MQAVSNDDKLMPLIEKSVEVALKKQSAGQVREQLDSLEAQYQEVIESVDLLSKTTKAEIQQAKETVLQQANKQMMKHVEQAVHALMQRLDSEKLESGAKLIEEIESKVRNLEKKV